MNVIFIYVFKSNAIPTIRIKLNKMDINELFFPKKSELGELEYDAKFPFKHSNYKLERGFAIAYSNFSKPQFELVLVDGKSRFKLIGYGVYENNGVRLKDIYKVEKYSRNLGLEAALEDKFFENLKRAYERGLKDSDVYVEYYHKAGMGDDELRNKATGKGESLIPKRKGLWGGFVGLSAGITINYLSNRFGFPVSTYISPEVFIAATTVIGGIVRSEWLTRQDVKKLRRQSQVDISSFHEDLESRLQL